jgi:hypothetical protein
MNPFEKSFEGGATAELDMITQAISRGQEGKEAALMLISQAIPCVMHLVFRITNIPVVVMVVFSFHIFPCLTIAHIWTYEGLLIQDYHTGRTCEIYFF